MNDDYSDAFKSIVPEAPSADGWADGARRKRRNRGRVVAGVTAVVAIAVVVPFALNLGSNSMLIATPDKSDSPSTVTAGPSPDPAMDAPGAAACWNGLGQPRRTTAEGAADGAVRAWLCGDAGDTESFPGAVGPLEPLVEGVDEIVDYIQAQKTLDDSGVTVCTEEYILAYRIVLDYGDGTSHVVAGALHGCQTIDDGPTVRTGGQGLYDLSLDLWRTQRAEFDAPTDMAQIVNCPPEVDVDGQPVSRGTRLMLPLDPTDAVTGVVCTEITTGGAVTGEGGLLNDELVVLIGDSVRADSKAKLVEERVPSWLTLSGAWGEQLVLQRTADDMFQWFERGTPMLWTPPRGVLAQIDGELPPEEPGSSPEPGDSKPGQAAGAQGCEGVTREDVGATSLEGGALPASAKTIWLCGEDDAYGDIYGLVGPLEPLVMGDLVSRAVEGLNALEPAQPSQACPLDTGPSYLVVFEYPDETKRVVEIEIAGCRQATAGEQAWQRADQYFDSLIGLWEDQRRVSPPVHVRPGPLCPESSSMFDLDPSAAEFASGSACVGWEKGVVGNTPPGQEIPLSGDLLADLSAQLDPSPTEIDFEGHSDDSLVLVTTAGDPLTVLRQDDGRLLVWGVSRSGLWTPTGALASELETIFGG